MGEDAARCAGRTRGSDPARVPDHRGCADAVATAAAGPIFFVALAAPQLAQRLTRTPGVAMVPAAAMGAFLLMRQRLAGPACVRADPAAGRRGHRVAWAASISSGCWLRQARRSGVIAPMSLVATRHHHRLRQEDDQRASDLDVPAGSFTAIIGPNACGKSTLLRALSRLLKPSAGEVVLDGRTFTRARPRRSPGGSGCCRSRRSRRTASRWPSWWRAAGSRTRS